MNPASDMGGCAALRTDADGSRVFYGVNAQADAQRAAAGVRPNIVAQRHTKPEISAGHSTHFSF